MARIMIYPAYPPLMLPATSYQPRQPNGTHQFAPPKPENDIALSHVGCDGIWNRHATPSIGVLLYQAKDRHPGPKRACII